MTWRALSHHSLIDGALLRRAADYVLSASAYDATKDEYFPVFGCPASLAMKTAAPSVDMSSLSQPASLTNTAGAAVAMPIVLRDVFGNPMVGRCRLTLSNPR